MAETTCFGVLGQEFQIFNEILNVGVNGFLFLIVQVEKLRSSFLNFLGRLLGFWRLVLSVFGGRGLLELSKFLFELSPFLLSLLCLFEIFFIEILEAWLEGVVLFLALGYLVR